MTYPTRRKRRKATKESETRPDVPLSELRRHQDLWFSDGTIILAAGNMCFKVHRSQLARFCTVFEDMLGIPSGGPGEELIEDVVVVRMHDDVEDLTYFLSALYNSWSFDFNTISPQNFPVISGVMRIATKYDCSVLRSRILKTLTARYPPPPYGIYCFSRNVVTDASVINLARECDIPEVLPSCFYRLAFCPKDSNMGRIDTLTATDRKNIKLGRCAVLRRLSRLVPEELPDIVCPISISSRHRGKSEWEKLKCITFLNAYWKSRVVAGSKSEGQITKDPLKALSTLCSPKAEDAHDLTSLNAREAPICEACKSQFNRHMHSIAYSIQNNLVVDFKL